MMPEVAERITSWAKFLVINLSREDKPVTIRVSGAAASTFGAFRTSDAEQYAPAGRFGVTDGALSYTTPGGSVTTFFATGSAATPSQ